MKSLLFILSLILICSCVNKGEQYQKNINDTLNQYFNSKLNEEGVNLDKFIVYNIDSVSSKSELNYRINLLKDSVLKSQKIIERQTEVLKLNIEQVKLFYHLEKINNSSTETADIMKVDAIKESNKIQFNIANLNNLNREIDSLNNIYLVGNIDSTDFKYYIVYFNICVSNKKTLEQECKDSLFAFVTKDYKIKTIK